MVFGTSTAPSPGLSHHAAALAPNGNWAILYDGAVNPLAGVNGVVYATSGRMAAAVNGGYTVDVSDGNDANGIQNYVDSQHAFVCEDNQIRVIWRFKPAVAAVAPWRTFYWMWAHSLLSKIND